MRVRKWNHFDDSTRLGQERDGFPSYNLVLFPSHPLLYGTASLSRKIMTEPIQVEHCCSWSVVTKGDVELRRH